MRRLFTYFAAFAFLAFPITSLADPGMNGTTLLGVPDLGEEVLGLGLGAVALGFLGVRALTGAARLWTAG